MLELFVANKNYSSWSLRPWLALRATGIAFEERKVGLFTGEFERQVGRVSPAGLVPVLLDGDFAVWDSLAICEYAAQAHPDRGLWPADTRAQARARSLAAQMHSGFGALRAALPMNIEAHLPELEFEPRVRQDIAQVQSIWHDTRAEFGRGGPFLFGRFSIADAFYAPVVSRFVTYGVPAAGAARGYMDAVLELPALQEWMREARAEATFLVQDEPYRRHR